MRIIAISKKVLKELLRDKRTLAMMFIAPIFIMWLMRVMFSANSETEVRIATVGIEKNMIESLDEINHVSIKKYKNLKEAELELVRGDVDAVLSHQEKNYKINYANTDSSKTAITRQAVKTVINSTGVNEMIENIKQLSAKNQIIAKSLKISSSKIVLNESYNYGDEDTGFFSKMIPILMGFIVFFFVFLISGMALLKERTSGTLDRILATPVKRSDIVFGYMISYGVIAVIQTLVIVFSTIYILDLEVVGSIANVIVVNFVLALVALAFGILLSTLAKSEFQMMQFIPLVVMPQLFFSGIIPLDSMADWVKYIGRILPLSYSGDALTKIIMHGNGLNEISQDIYILLMFLLVLTIANIFGLKRYRKV